MNVSNEVVGTGGGSSAPLKLVKAPGNVSAAPAGTRHATKDNPCSI